MNISSCWHQRHIANALVLFLMAPLAQASAMPRLPQDTTGQTPAQAQQQGQSSAAPAGSANRTTQPALPSEPQNHSQPQDSSGQPANPQTAPAQQTSTPEPVGTAAAPYEKPVGTAVSRPAGAAIAPAKQRRTRSFLIRMGLVIGAAVAVGTVVALSKASRSRP
jgi:hypothetical protein